MRSDVTSVLAGFQYRLSRQHRRDRGKALIYVVMRVADGKVPIGHRPKDAWEPLISHPGATLLIRRPLTLGEIPLTGGFLIEGGGTQLGDRGMGVRISCWAVSALGHQERAPLGQVLVSHLTASVVRLDV